MLDGTVIDSNVSKYGVIRWPTLGSQCPHLGQSYILELTNLSSYQNENFTFILLGIIDNDVNQFFYFILKVLLLFQQLYQASDG